MPAVLGRNRTLDVTAALCGEINTLDITDKAEFLADTLAGGRDFGCGGRCLDCFHSRYVCETLRKTMIHFFGHELQQWLNPPGLDYLFGGGDRWTEVGFCRLESNVGRALASSV